MSLKNMRGVLRLFLNQTVTLKKRSEAEADDKWGASKSTFTSFTIKARLISIQDAFAVFQRYGIQEEARVRGFFHASYDLSGQGGGTNVKVEVKDIINDGSKDMEVIWVSDVPGLDGDVVYREALLR